ncbi:MAG: exodeoxyribonuclease VII large subunit [Halieaceae bacterium]|jgi:exodeoxyribonuclease VII large subunit|nr:exodeoxyribonuclease VII large subunit [Halieaceae bacterium]
MASPYAENNLPATPETLSVSQLNRQAKRLLESHFDFVWIEGEISNLAMPSSGHWYFSLKDDSAQVRCAMFRNRNQRLRLRPEPGQLVRVRARVSLYEGRGEFQLIVEHLEDAGAGALQRAFEALKRKLQAEGLFDAGRKRPLPAFPQHIVIVSSRSGAALRDLLTVFKRRFPALGLTLVPASVQGLEAPAQLCAALELAYTQVGVDAIVIARGGGSAEDLAAFNDEALARKIAESPVPVVSAVGHETDFTIADLVADQRAATPSVAAEMLSPDQRELAAQLLAVEQNLARQYRRHLKYLASTVSAISARIRHPGDRLREQSQRLDDLDLRLRRALSADLREKQQRLHLVTGRLRATSPRDRLRSALTRLNHLQDRAGRAVTARIGHCRHTLALQRTRLESIAPQRTLERGYAIVRDSQGRLVRRSADLQPGDRIRTQLAAGYVDSTVDRTGEDAGSQSNK